MRFKVEELDVQFPYPRIYPEQYQYMLELKRSLDAGGHSMLEMPTGTGKTITLLSLITSYQRAHPDTVGKLIYCTRTIPEMEKVLEELKVLEAHRDELFGAARPQKILAVGLSSRRNLCVHERVSMHAEKQQVDQECRQLTAPWVRQRAGATRLDADGQLRGRGAGAGGGLGGCRGGGLGGAAASASAMEAADDPMDADDDDAGPSGVVAAPSVDSSIELCDYYEALERQGTDTLLPEGVYTLEELRELGKQKGWCPYFLARHAISFANVVVYNYQYLLDPKIYQLVSKSMQSECVVVFDEAHNIDNICIEVMSINFRLPTLEACSRNLTRVSAELDKMGQTNKARLEAEYRALVQGMAATLPSHSEHSDRAAELMPNPVLPAEILNEAVPGNLRRADRFVKYLRKLVQHLRTRIEVHEVVQETPTAFLHKLDLEEDDFSKPMKFVSDRLRSLLRTLEFTDVQDLSPLMLIADFATLVATYQKGFGIIIEPYDERTPTLHDPLFQFCCHDASIAMKPVFERFKSVVITSGTLSPLDMYKKILSVEPVVVQSFQMSFARDVIRPLVVTHGADQAKLTSKFEQRSDPATIRNYGKLLLDCAQVVPDGVVAFFTSYSYMQEVVREWHSMKILKQVLQHKLVFIETTDVMETSLALDNFKRACDCGRGAVFLSVARGKVAEGVDFDRHYGRAVLLLGVPFQYTQGRVLRARLDFLRDTCGINEQDFLTFDAIRQAAQCAGRVIRGKNDYGLVVFADHRYNKHDKKSKLPQWIQQFMSDSLSNLSTDVAMAKAREFLREMAQPVTHKQVSLGEAELQRSSVYVSQLSVAGIDQRATEPMEGAPPPPAAGSAAGGRCASAGPSDGTAFPMDEG
jgi:DNA excision repair protein ERCC-2